MKFLSNAYEFIYGINEPNALWEGKLLKYANRTQHWIKGLLDLKGRHAERSKIIM